MNQLTWPEVAHLYLRCTVFFDNNKWRLISIHENSLLHLGNGSLKNDVWAKECKPILRPLSSMTDEEQIELKSIQENGPILDLNHIMLPNQTFKRGLYLLSRHFDLFNLIPTGQAIDATTL